MKVYLVEGWFGDHEWIEGVYETEEKAHAVRAERWKTRTSPKLAPDDYKQGHCKFAVEEWEVQ